HGARRWRRYNARGCARPVIAADGSAQLRRRRHRRGGRCQMVRIQKSLCPVDQSEASGRALDYALMLSRWYGASLTAVEVAWAGLPSVSPAAPTLLSPAYLQESWEALRRFVDARAGDAAVETKLVHGPIVANVVDEARGLPADLIVIGTHGRGGFERFVLGSVAEKVL